MRKGIPKSKLTNEQKQHITRIASESLSYYTIAEMTGTTPYHAKRFMDENNLPYRSHKNMLVPFSAQSGGLFNVDEMTDWLVGEKRYQKYTANKIH
jgi:hypothetical protein